MTHTIVFSIFFPLFDTVKLFSFLTISKKDAQIDSGIGGVERPGIVHRLDKDTSGCLVIAKNDGAHQSLTAQFLSLIHI